MCGQTNTETVNDISQHAYRRVRIMKGIELIAVFSVQLSIKATEYSASEALVK